MVPAYPPFLEAPGLQGRQLATAPARLARGRWELPLDELEAAVTPQTRALLFCHPHNPLGRVWSAAEVAAVVELCRRHELVLVSDEIHCDLLLEPGRHVPSVLAAAGAPELTVTLMAPSKTFNLPGLNFAFAVIPNAGLRQRFAAAGAGLLPFPGCFAIAAAEAAYRRRRRLAGRAADVSARQRRSRRVVRRRRAARRDDHPRRGHLPRLARRARVACGPRRRDPAKACLQAGVALSGGAAFGADPGFLRLNFGCPAASSTRVCVA